MSLTKPISVFYGKICNLNIQSLDTDRIFMWLYKTILKLTIRSEFNTRACRTRPTGCHSCGAPVNVFVDRSEPKTRPTLEDSLCPEYG